MFKDDDEMKDKISDKKVKEYGMEDKDHALRIIDAATEHIKSLGRADGTTSLRTMLYSIKSLVGDFSLQVFKGRPETEHLVWVEDVLKAVQEAFVLSLKVAMEDNLEKVPGDDDIVH